MREERGPHSDRPELDGHITIATANGAPADLTHHGRLTTVFHFPSVGNANTAKASMDAAHGTTHLHEQDGALIVVRPKSPVG